MEINEENFKQVLFEYACEKYGTRFKEFYGRFKDEFPYDNEGFDPEIAFKNFLDWLMIEKPLPETGKTIVEEYVDKNPGIKEEMKQKLLQMKNMIDSEFVVISKKQLHLKLKDMNSEKTYNVVLHENNSNIHPNTIIEGRIHPFGDVYRTTGALWLKNSPLIMDPDIFMYGFEEGRIKEAENIILTENSNTSAIMNKYPIQWVNGICEAYSIDTRARKNIKAKEIADKIQNNLSSILESLPEKSKEALKFILKNDSFVKYNKLKNYEDEISFWWSEHPPESTIGILRLHGLLVVGKMPMNGKLFKVALIPHEIRDKLKELLLK